MVSFGKNIKFYIILVYFNLDVVVDFCYHVTIMEWHLFWFYGNYWKSYDYV